MLILVSLHFYLGLCVFSHFFISLKVMHKWPDPGFLCLSIIPKATLSLKVLIPCFDAAPVYVLRMFSLHWCPRCACPQCLSKPTEIQDGEQSTGHFNNCGLTLFVLLKLPLGEQVLFFIISYLSWIDTIKNNS